MANGDQTSRSLIRPRKMDRHTWPPLNGLIKWKPSFQQFQSVISIDQNNRVVSIDSIESAICQTCGRSHSNAFGRAKRSKCSKFTCSTPGEYELSRWSCSVVCTGWSPVCTNHCDDIKNDIKSYVRDCAWHYHHLIMLMHSLLSLLLHGVSDA